MSSTNKTTYYNLSQYIGTDKPTYLGDYNSDMSKIDGAIHEVQETATTANQTAGEAVAKTTTLESQVNTVSENVKSLLNDVTTIKNNVSQNTDDIGSVQKQVLALEGKTTSINSQISDIQNRLNSQWVNSGNVINNAIPSLSLANSFFYVGYNKLTKELNIYFSIQKTEETTTPAGQVIGTIPQEILNSLNIKSSREIVNGCTASYLYLSTYFDIGKNLKIDTNGQISVSSGTPTTAYIQGNLMINTSAWS